MDLYDEVISRYFKNKIQFKFLTLDWKTKGKKARRYHYNIYTKRNIDNNDRSVSALSPPNS